MKIKHTTLLTIAALGLAACGSDERSGSAAVEIKGTSPTSSAPSSNLSQPLGQAPTAGVPDSQGVVSYDGYQAAVARRGDTVASVADRIGLSAAELGAYNGLAPSHQLREGDELVLPPKPGGYGSQPGSAPTYDSQVYAAANPGQVSSGIQAAPLDGGAPAPAPSTSADAGWSPDLAAAAIERSTGPTGLDEQGNLAAPPSSAQPLPPAPQPPVELASPQLRQYQTPGAGAPQPAPTSEPMQVPVPAETLAPLPDSGTATTPTWQAAPSPAPEAKPVETITTPAEDVPPPEAEQQIAVAPQPTAPTQPAAVGKLRLIQPVTGPIVTRFGQGSGRASSDGIDFAAAANSPVVAAAAGEVALVSQSLGGLGNIVLIRHQGEYLTVYGRIEKVTVRKGDLVEQGQRIGVVSPSPKPSMHFELRRGAEGLDPEQYF